MDDYEGFFFYNGNGDGSELSVLYYGYSEGFGDGASSEEYGGGDGVGNGFDIIFGFGFLNSGDGHSCVDWLFNTYRTRQ